jgi:hypothetical protein
MNLTEYEILALFYIPYSLITWSIDFLSDKEITKNEFEIGSKQFLHHIISSILVGVLILLLTSRNISITILSIIITLGSQVGWLINNDYCFYTKYISTKINPDNPDRKWRNDFSSFIKHYLHGDSWAYSKIYNQDKTSAVIYGNVILTLQLIKIIMFKRKN